jgi:hypothetical protein
VGGTAELVEIASGVKLKAGSSVSVTVAEELGTNWTVSVGVNSPAWAVSVITTAV